MGVDCALCGEASTHVEYDGPIRSGGPGSELLDDYTIRTCGCCDATFLDPFPDDLLRYYAEPEYWASRLDGSGVDPERLKEKAAPEQLLWLEKIGVGPLHGNVIADFGAGAGAFLDAVRGLARQTIAVELAGYLEPAITKSGHGYVQHSREVVAESLDVVTSFDTLEHVESPRDFMNDVRNALRPGGRAFIGVPNRDDFLRFICPAYAPHFFHKSHLWYFSAASLCLLATDAGFTVDRIDSLHKYDLMNMAVWLSEGRGRGTQGSDLFDDWTEHAFRGHLERQGIGSHILVHVTRPL
jgi:SAM-dependent methyltransferase